MPSLNLVSVYTNPYKLIRTLSTSAPPVAFKASHHHHHHHHHPTSLYLNLCIANKLGQVKKSTPLAPLVLRNPSVNLGFRNCKSISSDRDGDWGQNGVLHQPDDEEDEDDERHSKLLTLPTLLTIARVAAVPVLVNTFYMDSWLGTTATTSIFVFASVTDWLDGYLARKMKLSSQFGAFLDPVADKLMVATALILLCTKPIAFDTFGQIPWLLTVPAIAIIGREITMSAVREWAASRDSKLLEAVAVNNLGKWKTATQMTALTILLAARDSRLTGANGIHATGVVLLYISAWLAVWSLFVYMRKISKVLLK